MNSDGKNFGMSVDDYENMAVKKSNVAKKVAAGAGMFVAGGAVAGGMAYAAGGHAETPVTDPDAIGTDDLFHGAEAGADHPHVVEETHTVVREVPAPEPVEPEPYPVEPEPEPVDPGTEEDSNTHWDTTKNIYENGELRGTIISGEVDGHQAVIVDGTADGLADAFAVDLNDDGVFQENEIEHLTPEEHIVMEDIETPETENDVIITNLDYDVNNGGEGQEIVGNDPIHNDFADEKTGETYHNDYAENNSDYNNHAGLETGHDAADGHYGEVEPYTETAHHGYVNPGLVGGETGHDPVDIEPYYGDPEHIPGLADPGGDAIDHDYDDPVHDYDDPAHGYGDTVEDYDSADDDVDGLSEDHDDPAHGYDDPDDGYDDPDDGYDDPDDGYDDPDDGYDDSDMDDGMPDDGYDDPDMDDGMPDDGDYDVHGYDVDHVDDGMDHLGGEVILG